MARAAAAEIIPHRLYQRGSFLTWPRKQKERLLSEYGITVVLNMWSKVDAEIGWEQELDRFYIQWHCSPSGVPRDAERTVAFIVGLMRAEHCVLVHCEAGRGRSVWLAARLLAAYADIGRAEALAIVKTRVPGHDLTPTLGFDLA